MMLRTIVLFVGAMGFFLMRTTDGGAASPLVDDLMARLVFQASVQKDLALSSDQRAFLRLAQEESRPASAKARPKSEKSDGLKATAEKKTAVKKLSAAEMVAQILTVDQIRRLKQLKLYALGVSSAFLPEQAVALAVSTAQKREFATAVERYRNEFLSEFRSYPAGSTRGVLIARLGASHRTLQARLDRELEPILSRDQLDILARIRGSPPEVIPDAFDGESMLAELRRRAIRRPHPPDPVPLIDLARTEMMATFLELTPTQIAALDQLARERKRFLAPLYAGIEWLDGQVFMERVQRANGLAVAKDLTINGEVSRVVGEELFAQLRRVRFQLCGPGIIFGTELSKELAISADQRSTMLVRMRAVNGQISGRPNATGTPTHDSTLADEIIRGRNVRQEILLGVLTTDQRRKWDRLAGSPLPDSVEHALRAQLAVARKTSTP